jgi:hypothetical protein
MQFRLRCAARLCRFEPFLLLGVIACSSDSESPDDGGVTSFGGNYGWTCPSSQNCQDVFDFNVAAGSVLTIRVTNVSAGSVSPIALYAPGVALGGTNLLTGNSNELRCTTGSSCDDFVAGEHVDAISVQAAGTYRLAVTREWGTSCGGRGLIGSMSPRIGRSRSRVRARKTACPRPADSSASDGSAAGAAYHASSERRAGRTFLSCLEEILA